MILQKAILEFLCELLSISQSEWTDDENIALESIQFAQHRESFKLSEGFLVSEGKMVLPNFSKTRLALIFCYRVLFFSPPPSPQNVFKINFFPMLMLLQMSELMCLFSIFISYLSYRKKKILNCSILFCVLLKY